MTGAVQAGDLTAMNTLGLRGQARRFMPIDSADTLAALAQEGRFAGQRCVVLGGGSNIVVPEALDAQVLKMNIAGRHIDASDAACWQVRAGAGELWHDFVRWTLAQGCPGLENLSLIPGTVGAAPIQNIGAYGVELAERFGSLEAVHLDDGRRRRFVAEDCRFAYRDSFFKTPEGARWAIVSVTFALPRAWRPATGYAELARELASIEGPTPMQISDAVIAIRRRKLPDPAELGNAGSFFKNPCVDTGTLAGLLARHPELPHYPQADGSVKLAAGWLIERAGWKGRRMGPVGMYEKQALVLVNHGGATASQVRALADAVMADVERLFGVRIEPEPIFL